MARRVEWTETALEDMEQVAAFISRDSPHCAASIVRGALSRAASLDEAAERGRVVPELGLSDVREVFVHNYRLVDQVSASDVRILSLIHGARDLRSLWSPSSPVRPEDAEDQA